MSCCQIVGRLVRRFAAEQTSRHTKRPTAAGFGGTSCAVDRRPADNSSRKTDNLTDFRDDPTEIRAIGHARSRWHDVGFCTLRA
jgi:hypothetical protein